MSAQWPVPSWTLHPTINSAQVGGGSGRRVLTPVSPSPGVEEKQTLNSTSSQWMKQFSGPGQARPQDRMFTIKEHKEIWVPWSPPLAGSDPRLFLCRGPVFGPKWSPLSSPHLTILCSENADKSNNSRAAGPLWTVLLSAHHPHKT